MVVDDNGRRRNTYRNRTIFVSWKLVLISYRLCFERIWPCKRDGNDWLSFKSLFSQKYRQQLRKQGSRQSSNSNQRASPVQGYHSTIPGYQAPPSPSPLGGSHSAGGSHSGPMNTRSSSAINIPTASSSLKPPPPRIRGSVEGLNQEIEKLVLKGLDRETDDGVSKEQHSARHVRQ